MCEQNETLESFLNIGTYLEQAYGSLIGINDRISSLKCLIKQCL